MRTSTRTRSGIDCGRSAVVALGAEVRVVGPLEAQLFNSLHAISLSPFSGLSKSMNRYFQTTHTNRPGRAATKLVTVDKLYFYSRLRSWCRLLRSPPSNNNSSLALALFLYPFQCLLLMETNDIFFSLSCLRFDLGLLRAATNKASRGPFSQTLQSRLWAPLARIISCSLNRLLIPAFIISWAPENTNTRTGS